MLPVAITAPVRSDPKRPSGYARRILVCGVGLVPQVVTETLFALVTQAEPFVPTEVHLVSSRDGIRRAALILKGEGQDQLRRFCAEYGVPVPDLVLHELRDLGGNAIDDIRTPDDNAVAADAITQLVAGLSNDPESALHVSIAGGRKTMGYYLGYALSLFGRPQDRMSHVLVSAPFEHLVDFHYPTRTQRILHTRDGEPVDACTARVDLAEIPFVRMRDDVVPLLTEHRVSFTEAVRAAERMRTPPKLLIHLGRGTIVCDGVEVTLSEQEWLVYAWFAWRRRFLPELEAPLRREALKGESRAWFARMSEMVRELGSSGWYHDPDAPRSWRRDDVAQFLSERISRIHESLREALGSEAAARRYGVQSVSVGRGRQTQLQLAVAPDCVVFVRSSIAPSRGDPP